LQRPDVQLRAALDWQASARLDLRAEVLHTASAWDLDDDGVLARLPDSTSVNLRGFLRVADWQGRGIQLTASVDNLTDELILPQLGLPAPGRTWRIGIRVN
ncbi:MAG: TonB-dependent receptor, partial [Woeseiaceae bacterium]|nr:TonB-dependent receptor [Woeseiaceae bacterium]NNL62640.1 TonB-dependent receptor [Woeseiaceae bacterium]